MVEDEPGQDHRLPPDARLDRLDERLEEAQRKECSEVLGKRCRDLENDEEEQRDYANGRAPELRELREWREEHWPDAIPDDEER